MTEVALTSDEDNGASVAVIFANGGEFTGKSRSWISGRIVCQFLIRLAANLSIVKA